VFESIQEVCAQQHYSHYLNTSVGMIWPITLPWSCSAGFVIALGAAFLVIYHAYSAAISAMSNFLNISAADACTSQ
jgi:hypothetical protein